MEFVKYLLFFLASAGIFVAGKPKISDKLLQLHRNAAETRNIMVSFTGDTSTVINRLSQLKFISRVHKINAVVNALKVFAVKEQYPVQSILRTDGINYTSFWINNTMLVPNANFRTILNIAQYANVLDIEEEKVFPLYTRNETSSRKRGQINRWGIERIRADQVWPYYTGRGVVVAGIDSGVRYQHNSLVNNWRRRYGWYDPMTGSRLPYDDEGHGTHTMGTIVGQTGLGVAPEATWIACKACVRSCSGGALLACAQWVLRPFESSSQDGNAAMTPNIVSNSWGDTVGGDTGYDQIIQAWRFVDIIPVFASGNSGPNCGTAGSPGDRPGVIAVGNINQESQIYRGVYVDGHWLGGSSLGPPNNNPNGVKPDITAPGTNIWSASNQGNDLYVSKTGTSMSCPNVSGVIALMLQRNPNLTYDQIYRILAYTADRRFVDISTAPSCGGVPSNHAPNYVFGYGVIDAYAAVSAVPV